MYAYRIYIITRVQRYRFPIRVHSYIWFSLPRTNYTHDQVPIKQRLTDGFASFPYTSGGIFKTLPSSSSCPPCLRFRWVEGKERKKNLK